MTGRSGRKDKKSLVAGRGAVLLLTLFVLAGVPLRAQDAAASASLTQQPAEASVDSFAFDVATIKPSDPGARGFSGGFTPSGYSVTNFTFAGIVFSAYFSMIARGIELVGMPAWAEKENYDIVAHMDEATATSLAKLTHAQRQQANFVMLQKLLAERCKLVAHIVPTQVDGYVLVVGKHGSRLTPSKPGAIYPSDAKNGPDGMRVLFSSSASGNTESYYNAPVGALAERLGWGSVVVDRTKIAGRCDFTIRRLSGPDADGKRISDPQPDDLWDISSTGLELKRAKLPSQNLVIDHIERPSPN